jgi:hypothetical protein
MDSDEKVRVRILCPDAAEATREAASLRQDLLDRVHGVAIDQLREDQRAQDMGSTLALVFGTSAVTALASGIAEWIRRRRIGSQIELEIDGSRVKLTGEIADDPKQVERLVKALRKERRDA